MKKFGIISILLGGILLFVTNVYALDLKFDDDLLGAGGLFSYDGAGGALVGSGINIDSVTGNDTLLNDGVKLAISNGSLDFTTGLNISEGPSTWEFAAGGSFTLTGGIAALGINDGSVLVSGSFTSPNPSVVGTGITGILYGFGIDEKNEKLVDFFGIAVENFIFANTTISLTEFSYDIDDGSFSAIVENADFNNTPVPEPATMLLLGVGLIGLAGASRKKFFKK